MRSAWLWTLGLSVIGCGGPTFVVQAYPGPVREPDTIAIVRVVGKGPVQLLSVDGDRTDVRVAEDARLHVEVLPGPHALWATDLTSPDSRADKALFSAEPGRVYRPAFEGGALHVLEVDRDSDAPLRDVTRAAAPQG